MITFTKVQYIYNHVAASWRQPARAQGARVARVQGEGGGDEKAAVVR